MFESLVKDHDQPLKAYRLYVEANPLLANRNLANAIAAVEIHLSNATIATGGYAASTTTAGPTTVPSTTQQPFAGASSSLTPGDLTKIVDLLLAQIKSSSISAGGGSRGNPKLPGKYPTPNPSATPYCYFHGYSGHDGIACKKMKAENVRVPGTFSNAKLRAADPTAVPGGHP